MVGKDSRMKLSIPFILRYVGAGLTLATVVYSTQKGFDIPSGSLLFLGIAFIVSSYLWKK